MAESGYRSMCEHDPPYTRACYDIARLLFESGRDEEARKAGASFIRRFPDSGLVQPAAKWLSKSYAASFDLETGIAEMEDIAKAVAGSDAEDSVVFQIAVLEGKSGRLDRKFLALERIVERSGRWKSQLWDDALWEMIEVRRKQGDEKSEERLLKRMIDQYETSWGMGRYVSPYHDDALFRLGRILLARGEADKAYEKFAELGTIETSKLMDEGLLWAAKARLQSGKKSGACRLLKKIVEDMPRTTSRNEAIALAADVGCEVDLR